MRILVKSEVWNPPICCLPKVSLTWICLYIELTKIGKKLIFPMGNSAETALSPSETAGLRRAFFVLQRCGPGVRIRMGSPARGDPGRRSGLRAACREKRCRKGAQTADARCFRGQRKGPACCAGPFSGLPPVESMAPFNPETRRQQVAGGLLSS